jgi:hypothetical protein
LLPGEGLTPEKPLSRPLMMLDPLVSACHRFWWLLLVCLLGPAPGLLAQQQTRAAKDSLPASPRLPLLAAGLGLGYTTGLVILSKTWYRQSPKSGFHFFNDNPEWQQMDKAGHFYGAFQEGRLGIDALRAAGLPERKAIWYGGLLGFVLQSPIEWLDGYAAGYGASAGDLGANALGALALISQQLAWGEAHLRPKYSFHQTRWPRLRPQVLGSSLPEEMLKDYNGQTYWLAADLAWLLPVQSRYPPWLSLAVGYGAEQMVFGHPLTNRQAGYRAYRQYYLAPDIDFRSFRTRHKWLKRVFWLLDMVHLPAPAVEYNRRQGFKLHPIYF